jgi:cytochrome b
MGIAFTVEDSSQRFQTHMLLGMVATFLIVLRIIWGVMGTRYARFGSFLFSPKALFAYLQGSLRHTDERFIGHNPGSAYATFAMIILTLGLAITGTLMSKFEALKEAHEIMAFLMAITVVLHIIGLVWYTLRHRENITRGMIDGKKVGLPADAIASSRPLLGLVFLILAIGWTALVFRGHEPSKHQVTIFGQTIQLGHEEHAEHD